MNKNVATVQFIKKAILWSVVCMAVISACSSQKERVSAQSGLTQYVDPYIGTGFHGHVFMGANVPFGAVQLGPVNMSEGWDWCSGYHYSDSTIVGFSHTHLSGTGIGDLGDIALMPAIGNVKLAKGKPDDYNSGYFSLFTHDEEVAKAGYYAVNLKRYRIMAELTATERVGFHKYTFPGSTESKVIIDLKQGIGWDRPVNTYIHKVDDQTLEGYRYSTGWAKDQRIYFRIAFSKPFKNFSVSDSTSAKAGTSLKGTKVFGIAEFDTKEGEELMVKVAISPVSTENAADNMSAELPGWDFENTVHAADGAWNKELSKATVLMDKPEQMRVFYTALYHTMIAPSLFNDHNNDYLGTDKKVYQNASFKNLTTFSLWDTYRAAHPLFTILQPEKVNDMISTMLSIYKQQGKLPVWHLMGNETNTMVGNPGIVVVADAWLKGFDGFDRNLAFDAMKASAMLDERGLKFVKKYGFIPADSTVESVAMGLEYAIADWGVAKVAKQMGKKEDYVNFKNRSKFYKNYFDPETKFMRGRLSETEWRSPFSPLMSRHRNDDFCEGNSWQYTWLVPQDVEGIIKLQGGESAFITKLDSLFSVSGHMGEEASSDISGLIGTYAHGNEPSHHITYLYTYVGQPWKTAEKVRYILDSLYTDQPDGICGNEDVGQMSAWYILSSLGFYQVNGASGMYVFGSPLINEATLQLGEGKTFKIIVKNNSASNKYIQRVNLNGKNYTKSYIMHEDIAKGGVLIMEMGDKPSAAWGVKPSDRPYSDL